MGISQSCFHVPGLDDNDSTSSHCFCPKCFFQRLKNKHVNVFRQRQTSVITVPNEQKSSHGNKEHNSPKDLPPVLDSPDHEDVCPTCLEDYTQENPKIIAKCSHHYHLGCIYEWMERSPKCPACGEPMEFIESS